MGIFLSILVLWETTFLQLICIVCIYLCFCLLVRVCVCVCMYVCMYVCAIIVNDYSCYSFYVIINFTSFLFV